MLFRSPYESVILQDKTGTIDAKVWEPNNPGIGDYDDLDYIEVYGDVTNFQGFIRYIGDVLTFI